jgi:hypothetical protein
MNDLHGRRTCLLAADGPGGLAAPAAGMPGAAVSAANTETMNGRNEYLPLYCYIRQDAFATAGALTRQRVVGFRTDLILPLRRFGHR